MSKIGPDFLFIGGSRCGSTWLSKQLENHNEIWISPIKELSYFNYLQRPDLLSKNRRQSFRAIPQIAKQALISKKRSIRDVGWFVNYALSPADESWYFNLFPANRGHCKGELTPTYMCIDYETIKEIHSKKPTLKVLMLIREPVDRSWSMLARRYRFLEGKNISGIPTSKIIEKICLENKIPFNHNKSKKARRSLVELNDYSGAYERWSSVFGTNNIFVGHFEDISHDPGGLMRNVFSFLEVKSDAELDVSSLNKVINQASENKSHYPPQELEKFLEKLYREEVMKCQSLFGSWCETWSNEYNTD